MGRQAYLNRLALGRSPYEPPETAAVDPSSPVRRVSHIHADSYMQQYDSRGHPVNPESKSLGRALRKAKNDILSTMGIVVSGEDRSASSPNEQQRINQITAENDFGLVITTADQLFVFFGSWWTSSLTGRIQTFRHYTHAALLDVIRSERGTTGILGFYFAGIPAWAVSSGLAIARDNPWKRTWTAIRDYVVSITGNGSLSLAVRAVSIITYFIARSSLLVLSVEAYMYSILQTLSIIPPKSIPSLRLLIPFGEESLIRLPDLPTDLSAPAIASFLLRLLASPGALEERIYRLIRRQVPKPVLADELSIRVAFEENLVEWVVPTLGRRADEEARRAKLTLFQDMQCELVAFREWVFSLFGLFSSNASSQQAMEASSQERIENLRNSIESLRHELEEVQLRNDHTEDGLVAPFTETPPGLCRVETPLILGKQDLRLFLRGQRTIAIDRFEHSKPAKQLTTSRSHIQRSTKFSFKYFIFASIIPGDLAPDLAPELLGNRTRSARNPASVSSSHIPRLGANNAGLHRSSTVDRRSIADFLEALILSQAQQQAAQSPTLGFQDDPSNIAAEPRLATGHDAHLIENELPNSVEDGETINRELIGHATGEISQSVVQNILPDGVEEPSHVDAHPLPPSAAIAATQDLSSEVIEQSDAPTSQIPAPSAYPSSNAHRVTLLSAHPVDSLASHLAAILSNLILAPLESLCHRSLAYSYLATHASSTAQLSDLHPLNLWFGGVSWRTSVLILVDLYS
ncbi:hypothetical protein N7481_010795 [Penicillium waksmanii]|uniref:uncharacterized protein n=1 Tax=Penicillium waksmanii TaxID=69791 RepID=UPI002548C123|nr:uncharacterized protein N7481_010795 [Penicillium waksmanii]KAJ5973585.1 hypothetical protein N7481_010795 [Penicillium waksmanii]